MGNIDSITYLTGQALQGLIAQGRIMDSNILEEAAVEIGTRTHRLLIENKNKRGEETLKSRLINELEYQERISADEDYDPSFGEWNE